MINKNIESILFDDGKNALFSLKFFLYLLSCCFSGITKIRTVLYQKQILKSHRLPCKVISIGNLAAGGTGKTPMTIYMAQLVQRLGYKPVVISRGYKGNAENTGGMVSDGKHLLMDYNMAGDEALMIAKRLQNIPVLVGKNRHKSSITAIEKFNPDVVILDDAFQHLKLDRDIDLVLLDHGSPLGNGHLLPRGILREPASALSRSDAVIFTRSKNAEMPLLRGKRMEKPAFKTTHTPHICHGASGSGTCGPVQDGILKNRKIYLFSGIANNHDFQDTMAGMGGDIVGTSFFPDHHKFAFTDLQAICRAAKDAKADIIATTEKNVAGITDDIQWPCDFIVVGIDITFSDAPAFETFITDKLVN